MQDSEPDIIDGAGAEPGHVIRTTLRGRNGQSRQVGWLWIVVCVNWLCSYITVSHTDIYLDWQTVSYISEHVVGTGSFGMVFQVSEFNIHDLLVWLHFPHIYVSFW